MTLKQININIIFFIFSTFIIGCGSKKIAFDYFGYKIASKDYIIDFELKQQLYSNIITKRIYDLHLSDSIIGKNISNFTFKNYLGLNRMGTPLYFNEFKLINTISIKNNIVYYFKINLSSNFQSINWKSKMMQYDKLLTEYSSEDKRSDGYISIDTLDSESNQSNVYNVTFISGNDIYLHNYFDYCNCLQDSTSFLYYILYKYHTFNNKLSNIEQVGTNTYKVISSKVSYKRDEDTFEPCNYFDVKYYKFIKVNNRWEDIEIQYYEIE